MLADERLLPENLDAEKIVLGSALTDPEAWPVIAELLEASDFSVDKHRNIFAAIQAVYSAGHVVNFHSVSQQLLSALHLQGVGSVYLLDLCEITKIKDLDAFCAIVKRTAVRRQVILGAVALIDSCHSGEASDADIERIREMMQKSTKRLSSRTVQEVITERGGLDKFLSPQTHSGIRIPFVDIQETVDGLRPQCFVILGARPGVGKTAFALQVAEQAAARGKNVLFVSLEMGADRLIYRAISNRAAVSSYKIRNGKLLPDERASVFNAAMSMASLGRHLLFVDEASMTVEGLEALLRSLSARNHEIDLVVVDYLQLMGSAGRYENRVQHVSAVSRGLKAITMRYGLPVLALSQLTRKEGGETQEPELSWLKESGQLEQDADQVLFLWPKAVDPDAGTDIRHVRWKVAKNRDGTLNSGTIVFSPKLCRFADGVEQQWEQWEL